jgi:hypothetical protein
MNLIAVLTLHNAAGSTKGEAEIICDRLSTEIFKTGGVRILEREKMKTILVAGFCVSFTF